MYLAYSSFLVSVVAVYLKEFVLFFYFAKIIVLNLFIIVVYRLFIIYMSFNNVSYSDVSNSYLSLLTL